eukprot:NODE_3923_length_862_cov_5.177122_g3256_i0.p2 GENE.NODE_3923_length_862_cov_5.177122_g3256_i0~~NODE_3923_length_862_cov_5.177122_g3256_i0.p2  ORF type:complete len:61 (+),score=4.26 NODE_3923_length_862_cov_5.177122_g3256_i0:450-632(+)
MRFTYAGTPVLQSRTGTRPSAGTPSSLRELGTSSASQNWDQDQQAGPGASSSKLELTQLA